MQKNRTINTYDIITLSAKLHTCTVTATKNSQLMDNNSSQEDNNMGQPHPQKISPGIDMLYVVLNYEISFNTRGWLVRV